MPGHMCLRPQSFLALGQAPGLWPACLQPPASRPARPKGQVSSPPPAPAEAGPCPRSTGLQACRQRGRTTRVYLRAHRHRAMPT